MSFIIYFSHWEGVSAAAHDQGIARGKQGVKIILYACLKIFFRPQSCLVVVIRLSWSTARSMETRWKRRLSRFELLLILAFFFFTICEWWRMILISFCLFVCLQLFDSVQTIQWNVDGFSNMCTPNPNVDGRPWTAKCDLNSWTDISKELWIRCIFVLVKRGFRNWDGIHLVSTQNHCEDSASPSFLVGLAAHEHRVRSQVDWQGRPAALWPRQRFVLPCLCS